MNQYEFMWIVGSGTDDEEITKLNKSLLGKIETNNGSISVMENYGR